MSEDLDRRVLELENRLRSLEDDLAASRRRVAREKRRDRWARILFWVVVGGAYVLYLRYLGGLG